MPQKVQPYLCPICDIVHPEFQLDVRIRYAKEWFERYNEPTMVYLDSHGYNHALLGWGLQQGYEPITTFTDVEHLVKRGMEIVRTIVRRQRENN